MSWIIFAGISALILAFAIIAEKKALTRERSMEFAIALAIMNGLLSIPLLWGQDIGSLQPKVWLIMIATSFIAASSFFFTIRVSKHMQVSESSPLLALSPAFAAIFALIFLGEKIGLSQSVGLALLILGAFVLESKHDKGFLYPFKAILGLKYANILFLALILYGVGAVMDRVLLSHYGIDPRLFLGVMQILVAINFSILALMFYEGWAGIKRGFQAAGWLIVLVGTLTVLHRWSYAEAVSTADSVGLVSGVKRSSVLFVTLIGGELFHDQGVGKKFLAACIIFAGIMLLIQ